MRRCPGSVLFVARFSAAIILLLTAALGSAITWCHDYSYYRATEFAKGKGKDLNSLGTVQLKSRLQVLGYRRVAALKPGSSFGLKKGDVLIIGNLEEGQEEDHSAFVTDDSGKMDHLLQKFNESGRSYKYEDLEKVYDPVMESLLVRRDWTIQDFREKKRVVNGQEYESPYKDKTFLVYRRTLDQNSIVGVWTLANPRRSPKPFGPRTDGEGKPICTVKEMDLARGFVKYERTVTPPGSPFQFTVTFLPPPPVILEGEQVAFEAKMTATPSTQDFLGDELLIMMGGNGKKPVSKTYTVYLDRDDLRLTVGLCNSPKATTKVTNAKGEWVLYNPPNAALMVFDWPEFDPDAFIATRDILVVPSYFERLQFHYVRREMTLADAEALRYPDEAAK